MTPFGGIIKNVVAGIVGTIPGITYVGGAEGERIREDLTAVIAGLLTWATEHDLPQDKDAA
jgi:hypothetical protein